MHINKSWPSAHLAWLECILLERFGHRFSLKSVGERITRMSHEGGAYIDIAADTTMFTRSDSNLPCTSWNATEEGLVSVIGLSLSAPGLESISSPLIEQNNSSFIIHYDILGLTYWMLTRQEEVGCKILDKHDRFPATSSHAYKHGYLERPIVDEWLHILGQLIHRLWPNLNLKAHRFSLKLSHDVDGPSRYGFNSWKGFLRTIAVDMLKRREFKSAAMASWIRIKTEGKLHPADPANTFDWIMNESEKLGLVSAFYFICGRTDLQKDADYEPEHPAIRDLMRRISHRGHEIGLHPSYNTYQKPNLIASEAIRLRKICKEEDIQQVNWGGRMHYLRWDQPKTLQAWEDAGMSYDSTLGYASHAGFRCGTCFEYPAFNPETEKQLNLRIRPLIAMDRTVIASHYMGLGTGDAALSKFLHLKDICRLVNGSFTLLWHNTQLCDPASRKLYQKVIAS